MNILEKTPVLKAKDLKKGETVYMFNAWDFHYGENKKQNADKINGSWVYSDRTEDKYFIEKVTIHSCGKKQLYLMNGEKMKGQKFYVQSDGSLCNYFAATIQEAAAGVKELHELNKYAQPKYSIVYRNIEY